MPGLRDDPHRRAGVRGVGAEGDGVGRVLALGVDAVRGREHRLRPDERAGAVAREATTEADHERHHRGVDIVAQMPRLLTGRHQFQQAQLAQQVQLELQVPQVQEYRQVVHQDRY